MDYQDTLNYMEWNCTKYQLNHKSPKPKFNIYYNCIYWAYLGMNVGSEENKHRPVLITRHQQSSPICTIIPLTSQRLNDSYYFHIDLEGFNGTVLVEQMRVIDIRRIDRPVVVKGKTVSITQNDWDKISQQIINLYSMKPLPNCNQENSEKTLTTV